VPQNQDSHRWLAEDILTDGVAQNIAYYLNLLGLGGGVPSGLFAARPAAGHKGNFYFATDTSVLYYDNGTAWVTAISNGVASLASAGGTVTIAGSSSVPDVAIALGHANTWTAAQTMPVLDKGGAVFNVKAEACAADGSTDDYAALVTLFAAVPANSTIDFGGRTCYVSATPTSSQTGVTLRNGGITAGSGTYSSLKVTGANTTAAFMTFTRGTGQGTYGQSADKWANVVVNAANFVSFFSNYTNAYMACLYLTHANCNGSRIIGGTFTNSNAYQNSSAVYAAAGATGNLDIVVDGIIVVGSGCSDGIDIYDAQRCVVRNCNVSGMARLPTVTVGSIWTLVTGNVYKCRLATGTNPGVDGPTTDRNDGSTRIVQVNGTELGEDESSPTSPPSNAWSESGGYLYINLAGTNPNSETILSDINSGYGITFYITASGFATMAENHVSSNQVHDVDGFGIYMQLGSSTGNKGNRTSNNTLVNACLQGRQDTALPFAGIGWAGGVDNLSEGDTIITSGGTTAGGVVGAPGFMCESTGNGTVIGLTVDGTPSHNGVLPFTSNWKFIGCAANNNNQHGFAVAPGASQTIIDIDFIGCTAQSNGASGLMVNAAGGTRATANVLGGRFINNGTSGILFNGAYQSKAIGFTSEGMINLEPGIYLEGACYECIVDDYHTKSSTSGAVGVKVDAAAAGCTVGIGYNVLTTPLSFGSGAYVMTGGTSGAAAHWTGSGAPSFAAGVGDIYTDYVGTDQYICTVATGTWVALGGSGTVTSVSAGSGRITVATGTTTPVIDLGVVPESAITGLVTDLAAKAPLVSPAFTGTVTAGTINLTSASATAFSISPDGTANYGLQVDQSTASSATGIKVKSAAVAGGVAISVISSGTNEKLSIDAKGSGQIQFGYVSTGSVAFNRIVNFAPAYVALGGGAAPTLGTIAGSGPGTAAQLGWWNVQIAGTSSFVPIWR
jgi:hypothetical protein